MPLPVRDAITQMPPYVPGKQPRDFVAKLNTNENPYPPSPHVIEAIRDAMGWDGECARRYPDPMCTTLREALAEFDGVKPDQIVVGNGSDEILRLLITLTLDPGTPAGVLWPTYSYYEFLADQFGATVTRHRLDSDWQWPETLFTGSDRLLFITNPNPPVGTLYPLSAIADLCKRRQDALIVADEAYIGFAPNGSTAVNILGDHSNLVVTRTFSKSHQLAGLRVGYAIGGAEVSEALMKVKDSYNVNALSQIAATAAIRDVDHFQETRAKIIAERERLTAELTQRGFSVPESHGNFVFALHPRAAELHQALTDRGIHARWWDKPGMREGLRVTVGLPAQTDLLLEGLDALL